MTKQEFMKIAAYIDAGTGHKFDKSKLEVWFDVLGDLPEASLKAAARRCLQQSESGFPQPATLRRFAIEHQSGVVDGASEAWERVLDAVRRFSAYRVAEGTNSLDPLTQAALRAAGGFLWACEASPDNRTVLAAQFRRAYESVAETFQRGRQLTEDVKPRPAFPEAAKRLVEQLPKIEGN